MYGKSNMATYVTICKIDNQQEFAVLLLIAFTYTNIIWGRLSITSYLKKCISNVFGMYFQCSLTYQIK